MPFVFITAFSGYQFARSDDKNSASRRDSQSIVNIFERKDHRVIVAAWLRSSEANEVPARTGNLPDRRRESVSITLPCKRVPSIRYFTPFGEMTSSTTRLTRTPNQVSLSNIPLRGDTVFIALANCMN